MAKKARNYTKPELREKIKKKVIAGSKGGRPGQWSARKAQILAHDYEEAGGGYTGPKEKSQKQLSKWTKEKWHTADGKKAQRKAKGKSKSKTETARYLPDEAWKKLTPAQKKATDKKKRAASQTGKQFVANTKAAKKARKKATKKSPARKKK